jgi:hypothetical protein
MQSQEKYGLCQNILSKPDVVLLDTLTGYAQSEVSENGEPPAIFNLNIVMSNDPPFKSYEVGDEIKCKVNKGWVNFNEYKRIKKISVDVNEKELEKVSVEFQ